MKKIIAIIIAVLCFSSVTAFASVTEASDRLGINALESALNVSSDFQTLYYDGNYYVSKNLNDVEYTDDYDVSYRLNMSEAQWSEIAEVHFYFNDAENIIRGRYSHKNGTEVTIQYLQENYVEEYNDITQENWTLGEIDFLYPENNTIRFNHKQLLGKEVLVKLDNYNESYSVKAVATDGSFFCKKGELIIKDNEYYYIDFDKIHITDKNNFNINDFTTCDGYLITDKELILKIDEAMQKYLEDDFGFFENDGLTKGLSNIVLVIMFFIVPLVIAVIFVISALRTKTYYKKFFRIIYISALCVMAIFILIALLL